MQLARKLWSDTQGRAGRSPQEACLSNNKCFPTAHLLRLVSNCRAYVLLNVESEPGARANCLGQ